ncbi:MAG: histidine kinase dimerization/phosphoacceptor domain -containing protein [Acetobacteraceae bacterium]
MSTPLGSSNELTTRLYQQELIAFFGLSALTGGSLEELIAEASRLAASGLDTRLAKVLQYRPASRDFLVVSGVGWREGVVGAATLPGGKESAAGYAMLTGRPVLANTLAEEKRFRFPALLAEHGVRSAINVVIGPAGEGAYGVLEVDSTLRHEFEEADTAFLQALANVLAAAIERNAAEAIKDSLLKEKDLLMQEVHHRVKNSLQLVHTMLHLQARAAGGEVKRHLDEAARRIMTIGSVHHRLYTGDSVVQTDAAEFLDALLADMREMLAEQGISHEIGLEAPAIRLSANATTSLGLVVTELVTNAVKYGAGPITVRVVAAEPGLHVTVEDHGAGFPPDFDPDRHTGLGMRLVGALANSAAGGVVVDRSVPYGRISVVLKQ